MMRSLELLEIQITTKLNEMELCKWMLEAYGICLPDRSGVGARTSGPRD